MSTTELAGHTDSVVSVAFNATGKQQQLLDISDVSQCRCGNVPHQQLRWQAHPHAFVAVLPPASKHLPLASLSLLHLFHLLHKLVIPCTGSLLATASLDSTVRVWRVSDGHCLQTLEGPGDGVEWLQWHPKGDVLLAGSEDFTMWMWLAQSGQCMQVRVLVGNIILHLVLKVTISRECRAVGCRSTV